MSDVTWPGLIGAAAVVSAGVAGVAAIYPEGILAPGDRTLARSLWGGGTAFLAAVGFFIGQHLAAQWTGRLGHEQIARSTVNHTETTIAAYFFLVGGIAGIVQLVKRCKEPCVGQYSPPERIFGTSAPFILTGSLAGAAVAHRGNGDDEVRAFLFILTSSLAGAAVALQNIALIYAAVPYDILSYIYLFPVVVVICVVIGLIIGGASGFLFLRYRRLPAYMVFVVGVLNLWGWIL